MVTGCYYTTCKLITFASLLKIAAILTKQNVSTVFVWENYKSLFNCVRGPGRTYPAIKIKTHYNVRFFRKTTRRQ